MSLILHLSDLHLGTAAPAQRDYDDKVGLGIAAGDTDIDHLAHTLEALGRTLVESGDELDAIVVTGDLTKGNAEDGYEAFAGILDRLGDALPPASTSSSFPATTMSTSSCRLGTATSSPASWTLSGVPTGPPLSRVSTTTTQSCGSILVPGGAPGQSSISGTR